MLTEFIKANPSTGKRNYKSIEIIQNIAKKSSKGTINMMQIDPVNQMMYILPTMESIKELRMMCKVSTVICMEKKNKKDLHHVALLVDRKEHQQVIEFYQETVFGLLTEKKVRIPNIDFLFSKDCLAIIMQDIEYIEAAKTLRIRPFAFLLPFLGEAMFKSDIWTPLSV